MQTIRRIYTLLYKNNGLKIREISKILELDIFEVSEVMFSTDCITYWYQNDSSLWFAKEGALDLDEQEKPTSEPLGNETISYKINNKDYLLENEPGNCLSIYFDEISAYRKYSDQEVYELFVRYHTGDLEAYNQIVKGHLRLVVNIAKHYKSKGQPLEDIIQEGNIGLLKAIEKFDNENYYRFTEFAKSYILQGISSSFYVNPYMVRLPQNFINVHRWLQREINRHEQLYELPLSIEEINLDSETDWNSIKLSYRFPQELKDMVALCDNLDDVGSAENLIEEVIHREYASFITKCILSNISQRKKHILEAYFGIGCEYQESLSKIAVRHNLTRERVRQILVNTIKNIQAIFKNQHNITKTEWTNQGYYSSDSNLTLDKTDLDQPMVTHTTEPVFTICPNPEPVIESFIESDSKIFPIIESEQAPLSNIPPKTLSRKHIFTSILQEHCSENIYQALEKYNEAFSSLQTKETRKVKPPHKIVLLLSIIDLVANDVIQDTKVRLTDQLVDKFYEIWQYMVSTSFYKPDITMPFYHMQDEPFWELVENRQVKPLTKAEGSLPHAPRSASHIPCSLPAMRKKYAYARIDDDLFYLLKDKETRNFLRMVLISQLTLTNE